VVHLDRRGLVRLVAVVDVAHGTTVLVKYAYGLTIGRGVGLYVIGRLALYWRIPSVNYTELL
jgi:hypothetical protein